MCEYPVYMEVQVEQGRDVGSPLHPASLQLLDTWPGLSTLSGLTGVYPALVLCFLKLRAIFNLPGPWEEASSTFQPFGMVMAEATCASS